MEIETPELIQLSLEPFFSCWRHRQILLYVYVRR